MKKSLSVIFLTLFSILFFIGCEIGLGEEVDLEGPVISVTSLTSGGLTVPSTEFAGGVYCQKQVSFAGTAEDNVKLKSVHAEIKWSNENDYTYLEEVKLKDNNWTYNYEFDKEGAVFIKFVAEDEPGNISTKSSTVLTLYVDDTPPEGSGWYIDRGNGFTYNLQTLPTLQALNLNLSENKDAAQNEQFSIHADFNDTMGIKSGSVKIHIRDIDGNNICDVENSSDSMYAPRFDVTHQMLVANHPELATNENHYLQVFYDAEDVVTLPSSNKVEGQGVSKGWFIWNPESDKPRIVPQTAEENGVIKLNVKDTLSISVFDDDGLTGTHTFRLTDSSGNAVSGLDPVQVTFNGERDMTITLRASDTPMNLILTGSAKDKKTDPSKEVTTTINKNVSVVDGASPILIISSPENNKIPAVTMSGSGSSQSANITITGQTLDSLGCTYLEFVWVPDNLTSDKDTKRSLAKTWLDSDAWLNVRDSKVTSGTPYIISNSDSGVPATNGLKVWAIKLGEKSNYGQTSFKTQSYSFTVDMLNDFKYPLDQTKNEKGNDKFFYVKLTRETGKAIYQDYILLKDDEAPIINSLSPTGDMSIVESTRDLELKFSASKTSGLAMDATSYKIERIDVNPVQTLATGATNGYCTCTVSTTTLAGLAQAETKPKYRFSAKDIFGKEGKVEYTVVISDLPRITSITTTAPKTCKVGDEIILNANFSDIVYVDDNLTGESRPYIKISGITNGSNSITKAYCKYGDDGKAVGNGTTSIQFSYTVVEGDTTGASHLTVNATSPASPIVINSATKLGSDKVHLSGDGVNWTDSVSEKNIKVDGISPRVSSITFTSDATADNTNGSNRYLKAGRTLTATVNVDSISLQGTPSFTVKAGSVSLELSYDGNNSTATQLVFTTTIPENKNGALKYIKGTCINNISSITDAAGNVLIPLSGSTEEDVKQSTYNLIVDTAAPADPVIQNAATSLAFSSTDTRYRESVSFKLQTPATTDNTIKTRLYSLDGGSTWPPVQTVAFNTSETLNPSEDKVYQLTAKIIDFAGNESGIPTPVTLDIRKAFPDFSIECLNSDGYYKAGETINFKINFTEKVLITNSQAKIYFTGATGDIVTSGAAASITSAVSTTGVTSATFSYTVQQTDQFKLKVSKTVGNGTGVHLDGITDLYGFTQGTKSFSTTADFTREITCDGIIPYITSMRPDEETSSGSNIFKKGNKITIVFNEPVQKGSGNITLRQVAGWAIPPVISAQDFNTICNNLTAEQKNTLSMQENGEDMEDSECTIGNNPKNPQDAYHGTGQFVGPYKKSSQGLKKVGNNYVPDTSTKYVLAFDLDIWDTDITKTINVGKTFTPGETSARTGSLSQGSIAATSVITPSETRSTQQIREVLEAAHFHERILDVTSSKITASSDNISYTIEFPKGLIDKTDDLPSGREWELIIDKGAFIDYSDKKLGDEYVSTSSNSIKDFEAGTIKVPTYDNKNSFWSDKVATPVVRVDRYSYGLGIWQSDASGNKAGQILDDNVEPTGYVRVRIDCETKNAAIQYVDDTSRTGNKDSSTTVLYTSDHDAIKSYGSTSTAFTTIPTNNYADYSGIFAGGTAGYESSCKEYITAKATKTGHTYDSATAISVEGVFKTIVHFITPKTDSRANAADQINTSATQRRTDYCIRGTTGLAGEPYISPFPLRDSQVGSPFVRRTFRESTKTEDSKDYYWVSFEVLVDASYSAYQWGPNKSYYDWARDWGIVTPGDYGKCTNLRGWQ